MKLKALMVALFVAGLTASIALAEGPPGSGHDKKGGTEATLSTGSSTTTTTGESRKGKGVKPCRPSIELELAGTAASAPAGGSLALLVTKGGAQGQQLNGKQLTLDVSQAKVNGTSASGGTVRVHARACVDLVAGTVKIVASQVTFGKAKGSGDGEHTTTGGTTTTTAVSTASK